jgi:Uma2 family endonuclease
MSIMQSRIAEYERMYGQAHPGRRMTEKEFDAWIGEKTRAEWVDGEVEMMSAAVSFEHDEVGGWLRAVVGMFAKRRQLGVVHGPEILVRLPRVRRKRLPDVLFLANGREDLKKEEVVDGPPDLIMEVVSTESADRDWLRKYADYEAGGVREYWIVDPLEGKIEAYFLGKAQQYRRIRPRDGKITSRILAGFYLRPEWLLTSPRADEIEVLIELGALE